VLIEATIVTIDTSDGFELGVEISRTDEVNDGEGRVLKFSSFGLSTVDPTTGRLTLTPGVGFNGALLSADIADIIIRALETDSRARIVSRPSVLVNDNSEGVLESLSEEPFETVSVSSTGVERTSFGGFAEAGTNIRVRPQISDGDHLVLEYEIELSSFGEDASDALPPARQANTLQSKATIPDGSTIVVGGLTRDSFMEAVDRVPVLGNLPLLEYMFSSRVEDRAQSTLFVFIRAVILRDDKFADLKMLSRGAVGRAELVEGHPASEPVEME
jgi:general secretion pathway protein D